MSLFESVRFVIEATQWFKTGDHPLDYARNVRELGWEGQIVRRYRHPDSNGKKVTCQHCGDIMHNHGWIDTVQGGHDVCPGDWIITEPDGKGFYPCKPDVFAKKYRALVSAPDQAERKG